MIYKILHWYHYLLEELLDIEWLTLERFGEEIFLDLSTNSTWLNKKNSLATYITWTYSLAAYITWTELLAAHKSVFVTACPIIPHRFACACCSSAVTQTILFFVITWLVLLPICELPWTAVCPLPRTWFLFVSAPNPQHGTSYFAFSIAKFTQDKLINGD